MAGVRGMCLLGSLLLLSAGTANAETVRVEKVKGNQALIRLPQGMRVESGQELQVGKSSRMPAGKGSEGRDHKIGGSAEISSLSSANGTTSTSSTTIGVTGTYGWNTGTWEYGPQFSLVMMSATTSATFYSVGGFIDYNLTANTPEVDFLWGAGGSASMSSTSGSGTSSSGMNFFAGGFNKWFPLSHTVSLRTDLGLSYSQSGSTVKTTQTGLLGKAGFEVYF